MGSNQSSTDRPFKNRQPQDSKAAYPAQRPSPSDANRTPSSPQPAQRLPIHRRPTVQGRPRPGSDLRARPVGPVKGNPNSLEKNVQKPIPNRPESIPRPMNVPFRNYVMVSVPVSYLPQVVYCAQQANLSNQMYFQLPGHNVPQPIWPMAAPTNMQRIADSQYYYYPHSPQFAPPPYPGVPVNNAVPESSPVIPPPYRPAAVIPPQNIPAPVIPSQHIPVELPSQHEISEIPPQHIPAPVIPSQHIPVELPSQQIPFKLPHQWQFPATTAPPRPLQPSPYHRNLLLLSPSLTEDRQLEKKIDSDKTDIEENDDVAYAIQLQAILDEENLRSYFHKKEEEKWGKHSLNTTSHEEEILSADEIVQLYKAGENVEELVNIYVALNPKQVEDLEVALNNETAAQSIISNVQAYYRAHMEEASKPQNTFDEIDYYEGYDDEDEYNVYSEDFNYVG